MHINIIHHTLYRYAQLDGLIIQALRLWPAHCSEQTIEDWVVNVDGKRLYPACTDGFGNQLATHTIAENTDAVRLSISGRVETVDRQGAHFADQALPPLFFMSETELTVPGSQIAGLTHNLGDSVSTTERITRLVNTVRDRVDHVPVDMEPELDAARAFAAGTGNSQDHAHILVAAARVSGLPARYATGYLQMSGSVMAVRHAWAEIFVREQGWMGFDSAHRQMTNERYVRVAAGRDSRDAAPVRAVLHGGLAEPLEVNVDPGHRAARLSAQSQSQSGVEQGQSQS